jgi:hypothetical protein
LDEEEAIAWQDVLDEIFAGRATTLSCPFCHHTPLKVEETPTMSTRVSCDKCRKYIEGKFQ